MSQYLNLFNRSGKLIGQVTPSAVKIRQPILKETLKFHGIFVGDDPLHFKNKKDIFPNDPDPRLFVKAFVEHYYPHGLMQAGCYFKNEKDEKIEVWDRKTKKVSSIESLFKKI